MTTQLPPSDVPPKSMFPNLLEAEQHAIETLEEEIAAIKRAISLADALIGMSGGDAYKQFVGSVQDLKGAAWQKVLKAKTDREANLLVGACQAFDDMLMLMTGTRNNRARLAATLKTKEDRLVKLTHPETQDFLS